MFEIDTHIYSINDIETLMGEFDFIKTNKKVEYANVSCSIDIESSSFYEENEKRAIMYCWVLGINGKCIIGRTYDELWGLLSKIIRHYGLNKDRRMIFYIQNFAYEFQWFRDWLIWENVFALEPRNVVYARTIHGIEFRCSYILSGYSLETIGKNLTKYKIEKMVGDLDYSKIRHSKTPLTEKEMGYVLNDGLVVMAYIQEEIETYGNITRIPLTKTGKVRVYCRNKCMYSTGSHKVTRNNNQSKYYRFRKMMNHLQIKSVQEYEQLKRGFQGGFTHANPFYVGKVVKDVTSWDFSSSYPSVMIGEQFPMSSGEIVTIKNMKEFKEYLNAYCCLFDITFYDIESIEVYDHPISSSKCFNIEGMKTDNGRVVSAKKISTTITEQDFIVYEKFYSWKKIAIKNFRIYRRGYLPRDFVIAILDLYEKKNTLKGVEGSEKEYMNSKENLNSCYGMSVTDICRDSLDYTGQFENGGWETKPCDYKKEIEKYNKSKRRFLFYPWGVWVTAYARRNLFMGIYNCKMDYVYSDTDSIKIRNSDKHTKFIDAYNKNIMDKMKRAMEYHHLPLERIHPKTKEGKEKLLGAWDYDGFYKRFKTLGAKRYMVEVEKPIEYKKGLFIPYSLTISGLNKRYAIPYLYDKYHDDIFDAFNEGMKIPKGFTGKNTHTYIDFETKGVVTDYLGQPCEYYERSSIHMEECEYELSMARDFVDFLMGIQLIEE